jgi:hypothetical protein
LDVTLVAPCHTLNKKVITWYFSTVGASKVMSTLCPQHTSVRSLIHSLDQKLIANWNSKLVTSSIKKVFPCFVYTVGVSKVRNTLGPRHPSFRLLFHSLDRKLIATWKNPCLCFSKTYHTLHQRIFQWYFYTVEVATVRSTLGPQYTSFRLLLHSPDQKLIANRNPCLCFSKQ